jgi:hypothetical protein
VLYAGAAPSLALSAATGAVYYATFKAACRRFEALFAHRARRRAERATAAAAAGGSAHFLAESNAASLSSNTAAVAQRSSDVRAAQADGKDADSSATADDTNDLQDDMGAGGAAVAAFAAAITASVVTGLLEVPIEIARSRVQAGVVHAGLLRYLVVGGGFVSVLPFTLPHLLQARTLMPAVQEPLSLM